MPWHSACTAHAIQHGSVTLVVPRSMALRAAHVIQHGSVTVVVPCLMALRACMLQRLPAGWLFQTGSCHCSFGCGASGVYAGDPSKLSMKAAFGKVWRLENLGGSIIGGSLKLLKEKKDNPPPPRDP